MAKKNIETVSDQEIMSSLLKDHKDDHYNYSEERYYKVSTSSLMLDYVSGGGFGPGLHRFTGSSECGKTREALDVMANFLRDHKTGKALYIEAEGRLSKEAQSQHDIKYVTDASEWEHGTCFVLQSNVYELVADVIERLIKQGGDTYYFILLDSVDGLAPRESFKKTFDESARIAGGPVIASVLMKRIAIPLYKHGHMAIFLSQRRSTINIDPYAKKEPKMIDGSGGNALLHYANFIMDFEPHYKSKIILENEKEKQSMSNRSIGHYAKISIKKSTNESTGTIVEYPVKYGRKKQSGVWMEKEIVDLLLMWGELKRAGAWYSFGDEVFKLLEDAGCGIGQKHKGLNGVYAAIDGNDCAIEVLKSHVLSLMPDPDYV